MANVEFNSVKKSTYDGLGAQGGKGYDPGALYFIKDNGEIRKGSQHVTGSRVYTADDDGSADIKNFTIKFNGTAITESGFSPDNKPKKGDMLLVKKVLSQKSEEYWTDTYIEDEQEVVVEIAEEDKQDPVPEGHTYTKNTRMVDDAIEYSAYIYASDAGAQNYSSDGWQACSGNVDASKVIITQNIKMAGNYDKIGNFTKLANGTNATPMQDESGTACGTAGFSVYEIIKQMMNRSQNPTYTSPAVTLTISNNNKTVECGTTVTPSYSASLSAGSYQSFQGVTQPATGITASKWEVTGDGNNTYAENQRNLSTITATSGVTQYTLTAKATHGAGAVPKNNLNESVPEAVIPAGTQSATAIVKVTGYRAIFKKAYSSALTDAQIMALTSSQIRDFGVLSSKPTEWAFTNAQQFLIFVPATDKTSPDAHIGVLPEGPFKKLQVSVVTDEQTGATELQDYKVNIKDAGGVNGVDYVVWVDTNTSTATDTMTISWS